jgi:pimeloyl-ACP methyl ester carboxylesterase
VVQRVEHAGAVAVPGIQQRTLQTRTLAFHVAETGPIDAPIVLLLHGFPEFWYSWRHQLLGLSAAFRVVAPDLRGYGGSDKQGPYDLETLCADVAAIIQALGHERGQPDLCVTLVGHDWGGVIAWATAVLYPHHVERLAICNAPHPLGFLDSLWRHPGQIARSWYIGLFQVPGLMERLFRRDPQGMLARMVHGAAGRKGVFPPDEVQVYAEALMAPGTLEAALGYYRALPGSIHKTKQLQGKIQAPVLVLWGRKDPALGPELVDAARRYVAGPLTVQWFAEAGHWLQQEEPEAVTLALASFAASRP